MTMHARLSYALLACTLFVSGCGDKPTSATGTSTTTTVSTATAVAPAFTEIFDGKVPVNGSTFYSFTVTQYGTVNVTMTNVSGQFVPSTVTLGLGLGSPAAEDCAMATSLTTKAASTAQITGAYQPGVYCVRVYDVGNLFSTANVKVQIDFP
jgi:hypothetical protein